MNVEGCKEKIAVQNLLKEDEAQGYEETLEEFFKCWLCSDFTDGASSEERSLRLNHFNCLKKFLREAV